MLLCLLCCVCMYVQISVQVNIPTYASLSPQTVSHRNVLICYSCCQWAQGILLSLPQVLGSLSHRARPSFLCQCWGFIPVFLCLHKNRYSYPPSYLPAPCHILINYFFQRNNMVTVKVYSHPYVCYKSKNFLCSKLRRTMVVRIVVGNS